MCKRCEDSGTVGLSTRDGVTYCGPGPIPDYAKGVFEAFCTCDLGEQLAREERNHRRRMDNIVANRRVTGNGK